MKTRRCSRCFHTLPEKRNTFRPRWEKRYVSDGNNDGNIMKTEWTYASEGPALGCIVTRQQPSGLNYAALAINEYPQDGKRWPAKVWLDTFRLISDAKLAVEIHIFDKKLWP